MGTNRQHHPELWGILLLIHPRQRPQMRLVASRFISLFATDAFSGASTWQLHWCRNRSLVTAITDALAETAP
jgi:hypothetical protein